MGRPTGGGRWCRDAGEGGRSRGRDSGRVTGLEGAKRGSSAAGRGSRSAVRSLALSGETWLAGCERRASVQRPAGPLQCPAPALRFPRAARPRSVRGPANPSLSRRMCAHCSSERAGPARPEASRSLPASVLPPPPIVVGIRVPTGNVAMPLSPMKVGKGIRQSGGHKGWTEEAMQKGGGLLDAGQMGGRLVWARCSADQDYSGSHIGRMI